MAGSVAARSTGRSDWCLEPGASASRARLLLNEDLLERMTLANVTTVENWKPGQFGSTFYCQLTMGVSWLTNSDMTVIFNMYKMLVLCTKTGEYSKIGYYIISQMSLHLHSGHAGRTVARICVTTKPPQAASWPTNSSLWNPVDAVHFRTFLNIKTLA